MSQMCVDWKDPTTTILALLLLGHVLADFLFQSDRVLSKKKEALGTLALHASLVGIVQGVLVLSFSWSWRGLWLVSGIAVSHFVIDYIRILGDKRFPKQGLWCLLSDQAAHVCVLLTVWKMWPARGDAEVAPFVGQLAAASAVIVFNVYGGSRIVGKTLAILGTLQGDDDNGPDGAGRMIGVLERWIILGLVWAGQWGAVGLVLTAKSIARFKKMDEQAFAEIYLVGTMTSVLVAMMSGALLRLVLK